MQRTFRRFRYDRDCSSSDYAGEGQASKRTEVSYFKGIRIVRIQLPSVNKLSKLSRTKYIFIYFMKAWLAILREKNVKLIYTISQPPILGGLLGTFGKLFKRTKHVYNIQDFNPEQAVAASYTKNSFLLKVALAVDKINCRYSDHVVVVGKDMGETLRKRFGNKNVPEFSVINNWTEEDEILPLKKENGVVRDFKQEHELDGKFIVMYSGNLGLYYDLENLIKLSKDFQHVEDMFFLFIGEGAKKKEMQDYVSSNNLTNVKFLPYQPLDFIKYSLNVADVHLVVNQKGIKGVSVPSKIYGVLAAGKPILGVLENGSEAHRLIEESGCGLVAEPQDYDQIRNVITEMYQLNEDERLKMGLCGRAYLEQHLKKETSINKYKELLTQLTS